MDSDQVRVDDTIACNRSRRRVRKAHADSFVGICADRTLIGKRWR